MLYKLPQDVLAKIYEYDPTYRDIFKAGAVQDIHMGRWTLWMKIFLREISNIAVHADNDATTRFHCIMTSYFTQQGPINHFRSCFPEDITISSNYHNMLYSKGTMYHGHMPSYATRNTLRTINARNVLHATIRLNLLDIFEVYVRSDSEITHPYSESSFNEYIMHTLVYKSDMYSVYRTPSRLHYLGLYPTDIARSSIPLACTIITSHAIILTHPVVLLCFIVLLSASPCTLLYFSGLFPYGVIYDSHLR